MVVTRNMIWRVPNSVCTREMADDPPPSPRAFWRDTGARLPLVDAKSVIVGMVGQAGARNMAAPMADQNAAPE